MCSNCSTHNNSNNSHSNSNYYYCINQTACCCFWPVERTRKKNKVAVRLKLGRSFMEICLLLPTSACRFSSVCVYVSSGHPSGWPKRDADFVRPAKFILCVLCWLCAGQNICSLSLCAYKIWNTFAFAFPKLYCTVFPVAVTVSHQPDDQSVSICFTGSENLRALSSKRTERKEEKRRETKKRKLEV